MYPKLSTGFKMMAFFTNVSFMEFQVKYLVLFHLLSVIDDSEWLWMGSFQRNIQLMLTLGSSMFRSRHPEVLLGKAVLKICSKFTGKHPCRSAISIKLLCNFIEITLRHGCSPVTLLHIFRTAFHKNTSGRLLLNVPFLVLHLY